MVPPVLDLLRLESVRTFFERLHAGAFYTLCHIATAMGAFLRTIFGLLFLALLSACHRVLIGRRAVRDQPNCSCTPDVQVLGPVGNLGLSTGPIDWTPWRDRKRRTVKGRTSVSASPSKLFARAASCLLWVILGSMPVQVWAAPPGVTAVADACTDITHGFPEQLPTPVTGQVAPAEARAQDGPVDSSVPCPPNAAVDAHSMRTLHCLLMAPDFVSEHLALQVKAPASIDILRSPAC